MKPPRGVLGPGLLAFVLSALTLLCAAHSSQDARKAPAEKPSVETKAEEVSPAPLTPRERVGRYVFLACLWLSIAFLLYFLRLRVREADRVFRTGLYGKPDGHEGPRIL